MVLALRLRTALALGAITALALVLRLLWLANTEAGLPPLSDPQYYHATAQNLAEGRGFSVAVDERGFVAGDEGEATAFWPPGYPFALAPLYKVTDSDERAGKALNALAGALTVLPVFVLGRALGAGHRNGNDSGDATGLIAAGLFAVAPAPVYWTAMLFSESLFTLGVATTLAVALWAGERRTLSAYFFAGLALIATAFVRSQALVLVVPCAVLLLRRLNVREIVRVAAPAAGACALLVVPWAIRNEMAMGRSYPINDNLGYNLRLAHAPYSEGTSVPPQDLWDERPGISFHERELFFDDEGRERAIEYALEHPGREVELAVKRVGYLLRSDAEAAVQWSETLGASSLSTGGRGLFIMLGDVHWYVALALAVASGLAVRPSRVAWGLWAVCGVWVLLHTVFAGEPRYHAPMLPVVVVLAAGTIARAVEALRAGTSADQPSAAAGPAGGNAG